MAPFWAFICGAGGVLIVAGWHQFGPRSAEWANQIRFWGNNAAHEDEPFTEEDARQMGEFTELFLTYLFTLPEKLAKARDQK